MTRAAILLAALAAALAAQWSVDRQALGVGLTLAALAALLAALAGRALLRERDDVAAWSPPPLTARQRAWLVIGVLLAAFGVSRMGPNAFTLVGTLAWAAGLGACLRGLRDQPPRAVRPPPSRAAWLTLAAIIVVGAVLRFYRLADLPVEAGCDIPLKLQVVRGILAGERPIYSAVYPGREVGFFYATALYGAVFGADQLALKVMSASVSLATVAALYALGARWFGRAVGLAAAAWLAVSPWHLSISRIGYRGVLTPLMVIAAMLALDRALARGARRDWAWLGVVVGACGYTYTAALATPLAVAGVALVSPWGRGRVRGWAAAALVAAVVALPLLRPALSDFPLVSLRAGSRLDGPTDYAIGERLLGNAASSVGMFNVRGDSIATQNVPFRRQLGLVSGALFLCGLGLAAARWRRRREALALWFLLAMQLPSALALGFPGEVPGAVRASGALTPACLLAGLPLPLLWRALGRRSSFAIAAAAALSAALLAGETVETWRRYFVEYAAVQPYGNYPFSRTIAAAMDGWAGRGPVYLPAYPYWLDGNALRIQLQRLPLADLHEIAPDQFDAAVAASSPPFMVVLRPDDAERLAALRARFPDAQVTPYDTASGQPVFVVLTTGS